MSIGRGLVMAAMAAALVAGAAGTAMADAKAGAKRARAHFDKGTQFYDLNRFDDALAEYEAAYLEKKDPAFLFNIAQCHRQLGHKQDAVSFYRNYLRNARDATNRPEVEKRIQELEASIQSDAPPRSTPPPGLAEPARTPAPEQAGAAGSGAVDSGGHTAAGVNPALPPLPATAATTMPDDKSPLLTGAAPSGASADHGASPIYARWWFWTAVGVVVAGGVITAVALSRGGDPSCPAGVKCQ